MNYKIISLLALFTSYAFAAGTSFTVIVREEFTNNAIKVNREMMNLEDSHSFDGRYFKIVLGKSKDAVAFDEKDPETLLRAANTYYHLNIARDYWVNIMHSERAANMPKMIVRINITNQFDDLGHFAHDNRSPEFNNALSIPAGVTPDWVPSDRQDRWDNEIWYRPMKKILASELGPTGPNPITAGLMAMERPLVNYLKLQLTHRLIEQFIFRQSFTRPLPEQIARYIGTYAMFKLMVHESYRADRLFMEEYYYLDTAMVPEVSFHEYSHVVLSDSLEMTHSTPVVEGMADYFAAIMSGKRKVYDRVGGYSNSAPKDTQEKRKYSHWDEANRAATGDFTLSVLWDVREALGPKYGDEVIYEARKFLKTGSSNLSSGLLKAILRACEIKCEMPGRDKYKLYEVFSWKGF